MTLEEFSTQFARLTDAFQPVKAEKRSRVYFEELRQLKADVFAEAVRQLIRDSDRFPSIAVILQKIESIKPSRAEQLVKQKCIHCDGYGWVIFNDHSYRGRCEHGKKLSERIPWTPETEMDKTNALNANKRAIEAIYGKESQ